MKEYNQTLEELIYVAEKALQLAEENKRPEEEITSLHEIARKIIHVK